MGSRAYIIFWSIMILCTSQGKSQMSEAIPSEVDPDRTYLLYLHGGVVQSQGRYAVSQYYGKYEYDAIIDTLVRRGFYVISEVRAKETDDMEYAHKVKSQVDTLFGRGVQAKNIVIVGASLGAYMTLSAARLINHPELRYVLIGLCSDYAIGYYTAEDYSLEGRFLSIYEQSDSKQSCEPIFEDRLEQVDFTEVELNTGLDHAFLFKPNEAWVMPLVKWVKETDK